MKNPKPSYPQKPGVAGLQGAQANRPRRGGSRKFAKFAFMFGGKLEAGGKLPPLVYAYKTMQQRWRKYYAKEKMPIGEEYTFEKEFEVWARMIKDDEGNDIQIFKKIDEKNRFRKDSSFYYDGYWRVFEKDEIAKTITSRNSLGIKIERIHDWQWRLTNKIITEKNDTLALEQYIWKDGRLAETIIDGVKRVYVYGKTLQDIVKVTPSDEGLYFHSGYNNTAGIIPGEDEPMYKFFVVDPYGYSSFNTSDENELPMLRSQNSVPSKPLQKKSPKTYEDCGITDKSDMPKAQCVRYERDDVPRGYENTIERGKYSIFYPGTTEKATFGHSTFEFNKVGFECECKSDGFFHATHNNDLVIGESIEIFFSAWYYEKLSTRQWEEHCWIKDDMRSSYAHEAKHIENAREAARIEFDFHMQGKYKTKDECVKKSMDKIYFAYIYWQDWKDKEVRHDNVYPRSPTSGGTRGRYEVNCK